MGLKDSSPDYSEHDRYCDVIFPYALCRKGRVTASVKYYPCLRGHFRLMSWEEKSLYLIAVEALRKIQEVKLNRYRPALPLKLYDRRCRIAAP